MTHIAYLGTGLLGSAFVEAALTRGDQVTVWNRTIAKARALQPLGARVAENPTEAVRNAVRIHLVLTDDAVVEDVIERARPGLSPQSIIVDHSTTRPSLTAERSRRLNAAGVHYLHCPVFIGPAAARRGLGTILVAGPEPLFRQVSDALARQATRVEYLGERPDLAAVYKLCGNAYIIGIAGIIADCFAVARGAEVPPTEVLKVFDFFNPADLITGRGRKMAARDFTPSFELSMARKDLRLMIETAPPASLGVLPGLASRMEQLIAEGHGSEDMGALAG